MLLEQDNDLFVFKQGSSYVGSDNPIHSEILSKKHSFCAMKQFKKSYSSLHIPKDDKSSSIEFYVQHSEMTFKLIEQLEKVEFNTRINSDQCLLIGYAINYASFLILQPITELKSKVYFRLLAEVQQLRQVRKTCMQANKDQLNINQLWKIDFYNKNKIIIEGMLEGKYDSYSEIRQGFRKILNRIYKGLLNQAKNGILPENGAVRLAAKIVYIMTVHLIDFEKAEHLKYYLGWKKTMERTTIKDIQNYIQKCELAILHEDIKYLMNLFF